MEYHYYKLNCTLALVGLAMVIALDLTVRILDHSQTVDHLNHGANFYQAYCAVHEPDKFLNCLNRMEAGG